MPNHNLPGFMLILSATLFSPETDAADELDEQRGGAAKNVSSTELEKALDRLDGDLSGADATQPANYILKQGADVLPLICDRLHRPTSFEKRNPQSRQSIINISFVLLAMKHKYPETLPQTVQCLFEWTLQADRDHPMRYALQSMIAVDFGDVALPALIEVWERASYDEVRFARVQKVGHDWFRFFCSRDGMEATTIDKLAELADELQSISRLNLYSQISMLARCSPQAVTVIKRAFLLESDADAKRTLHKIQIQAQHVASRGNSDGN